MKKHLLTIFILFLGIGINARTLQINNSDLDILSSIDDEGLIVESNSVNLDGKHLANFTVESKELSADKREITKSYEVKIFNDKNKMVAEYSIEVAKDLKNNEMLVKEGFIKTKRDNVTHNGANFLDYHMACDQDKEEKKCDVPQIAKVIKYLISYKYL